MKKKKSKAEDPTRLRNHLYQTSDHYKEHRRQRYLTDEEYREKCLARARKFAQEKQAGNAAEYLECVSENIKARKSLGTRRDLTDARGKSLGVALTYSIPELAAIISRPTYVVREWVNSGRFPSPVLQSRGQRGPAVKVYSEAQTVALARAAIKHLRIATAHLNTSRTEAIIAFHQAMRA